MFGSREDVIFAAGLFEGEGCFSGAYPYKRKSGNVIYSNPEARLTMTDKEVVEKFQKAIGFGKIYYVKPQKAHWKEAWKWAVGDFEHVQALGAMLWPWLGTRRRTQFMTAMQAYEDKRLR